MDVSDAQLYGRSLFADVFGARPSWSGLAGTPASSRLIPIEVWTEGTREHPAECRIVHGKPSPAALHQVALVETPQKIGRARQGIGDKPWSGAPIWLPDVLYVACRMVERTSVWWWADRHERETVDELRDAVTPRRKARQQRTQTEAKQLWAQVQAVCRFTNSQVTVLELFGLGLNQSDIARELGREPSNINASLKDIRERFERRMKEKSA